MKPDRRVLVVGTTVDYIDWIRRASPGRTLFLTDTGVRSREQASGLAPEEEIVCDLNHPDAVRQALAAHLRRWNMKIDGVACFDCDFLLPAARLAEDLSLAFPSPAAVTACRNKFTSKQIWRKNGIKCPAVSLVGRVDEAVDFFSGLKSPCVLKPLFGSGSELVFCCRTEDSCRRAFAEIDDALHRRMESRCRRDSVMDSFAVVAEALVEAPEFSCDFLLNNDTVRLIRLTRKIPAAGVAFGTTRAYVLTDRLPGCDFALLKRRLARAAGLIGLERAICMADFMVDDGEICFLEITPRPGGDCLPPLLRRAIKVDTIVLTLDLARNAPGVFRNMNTDFSLPPVLMAGLRVHAGQSGRLERIDWTAVADDPRVKEIIALRRPGDMIVMPPDDYGSFLLGNIIFSPFRESTLNRECDEILTRLKVEITPL